jgi:hypothetical protein
MEIYKMTDKEFKTIVLRNSVSYKATDRKLNGIRRITHEQKRS